MLSPEKIRATTGGIAFLPHPFRFSDTFVNNPSIVGSASHCNRSSPLHKGAKGDSALPTIPKPHYHSPRTKLASLVKGRWLDGKPQTVALLRFACDTSIFFIHQTFCRQDGGIGIPPFARHHIYASLVKGEMLSPEKIRATTGGIAFLPHPFRFSDTSVNNPSIVGSASHCNRSSPLHKGAKGDSALPTIPKPHYPSKIANTLASPRKRGGGTAVEFFACCTVFR